MSANDTQTRDPAAHPDQSAGAGAEAGPELDSDGRATTDDDAPPVAAAGRSRRRWVIAAAAVAGALWWLGWHSPVTLVEQVEVVAPTGISAKAVRTASAMTSADHVPSVDADQVRQAVMAAIPAVADVRVQRSLPDTIRLHVVAREPLAAVQSGDTYYVLDAEGVVFDKAPNAKSLPVFRASSAQSRDTARSVYLAIPDEVRSTVVRVTAGSRDDVTLGLRSGATVRWGGVEDSALKARVLAGLLDVKAKRYDVSAPLLPTTLGTLEDVDSSP